MSKSDLIKDQFDERSLYQFHNEIEKIKRGGLSTIEAICEYCEIRGIDVEEVVNLINQNMLASIEEEGEQMNLLKEKHARLA